MPHLSAGPRRQLEPKENAATTYGEMHQASPRSGQSHLEKDFTDQ